MFKKIFLDFMTTRKSPIEDIRHLQLKITCESINFVITIPNKKLLRI